MTLLSEIEIHLRETGTKPSAFGRKVAGDPRLVFDLRNGRTLRASTEARVRLFIDDYEHLMPFEREQERVWTPERDDKLLELVEARTPRADIARHFGLSASAIHARINRVVEDRFPDKPYRFPLADYLWNLRAFPDAHGRGAFV